MGEVYRARDTKLDRDVAIKVLPAHLGENPDAHVRFEREAKAVAALSHPNILAIHDFGWHDGRAFAVMELLEGEDAARAAEGGGPSPAQGRRDGSPDRARAGRCPREGHRPPRPEARERLRHHRRSGEDPGFRPGARGIVHGGRRGHPLAHARAPHRPGDRPGDRGLHVAGAGARPERGSPLRSLLPRLRPPRDDHGQARLRARDHGRDHDRDPQGGPAGDRGFRGGRPSRHRPPRPPLSREASRGALPVGAGRGLRPRDGAGAEQPEQPRGRRGRGPPTLGGPARAPCRPRPGPARRRARRGFRAGAPGGRQGHDHCRAAVHPPHVRPGLGVGGSLCAGRPDGRVLRRVERRARPPLQRPCRQHRVDTPPTSRRAPPVGLAFGRARDLARPSLRRMDGPGDPRPHAPRGRRGAASARRRARGGLGARRLRSRRGAARGRPGAAGVPLGKGPLRGGRLREPRALLAEGEPHRVRGPPAVGRRHRHGRDRGSGGQADVADAVLRQLDAGDRVVSFRRRDLVHGERGTERRQVSPRRGPPGSRATPPRRPHGPPAPRRRPRRPHAPRPRDGAPSRRGPPPRKRPSPRFLDTPQLDGAEPARGRSEHRGHGPGRQWLRGLPPSRGRLVARPPRGGRRVRPLSRRPMGRRPDAAAAEEDRAPPHRTRHAEGATQSRGARPRGHAVAPGRPHRDVRLAGGRRAPPRLRARPQGRTAARVHPRKRRAGAVLGDAHLAGWEPGRGARPRGTDQRLSRGRRNAGAPADTRAGRCPPRMVQRRTGAFRHARGRVPVAEGLR
jgi:hypothetical protein